MAIQEFKVTKLQNLTDICVQVYGTTQQLFKLAKDNGLSIDSDVQIGQKVQYDDAIGDSLVLSRIALNRLNIINPSAETNINIEYWTDGLGTIFTDGLGTGFTDL